MEADRLVELYLKELAHELHGLPSLRRQEILEEVREHIVEARAGLTTETDAEIRTLLDRLGEPDEIAREAKQRFGIVQKPGTPVLEMVTLVLFLLPAAGWLMSSVLVWLSSRWTRGDKIIGTVGALGFIPIGALTVVAARGADQSPVGSPIVDAPMLGQTEFMALLVGVVALLLPLATAIFLAVRLRSHRRVNPGL